MTLPPASLEQSEAVVRRLEELEQATWQLQNRVDSLQQENERLRESQLPPTSATGKKSKADPRSGPHGSHANQPDGTDEQEYDPPSPLSGDDPFKNPVLWSSEDENWTLEFHNETQIDMRAYGHDHTDPVNQFGFYIPRMRLIFNGKLSEPIDYAVSINKGLGSLDLLDAYLNFRFNERVQFRIGRYRVPFTYDWFALSNQFLATPERSVFALNLGYNRNTGAMIHGELGEGEAEYAVAAVNGPRNSYVDTDANKDVLAYLNIRPFFHHSRLKALKHLNVGGSYSYGSQDQTPQPVAFHTSASASSSGGVREGVPSFLELNSDVIEDGIRAQWEAHLAYYYRQTTFTAAIDGGRNTYRDTTTNASVPVMAHGWHVQLAYFLTGEEITRRTFVEVLRPFELRSGKRGPGAWEVQARFDHFDLDQRVFSAGLADPTQWTNAVDTIDCGVNWYLNRYVRIAFNWQHCLYDSPVTYRPGQSSDTNDLYWLRFQSNF